MSNDYYNATGTPVQRADGASSNIRNEFLLIEAGFTALQAVAVTNDMNQTLNINFTVNGVLTNNGTFVCTGIDDNGGVDTTMQYKVLGTKVVGLRQTGWAAPTGTLSRATFNQSTVTLAQLAQRVAALITDLETHGLIGT